MRLIIESGQESGFGFFIFILVIKDEISETVTGTTIKLKIFLGIGEIGSKVLGGILVLSSFATLLKKLLSALAISKSSVISILFKTKLAIFRSKTLAPIKPLTIFHVFLKLFLDRAKAAS